MNQEEGNHYEAKNKTISNLAKSQQYLCSVSEYGLVESLIREKRLFLLGHLTAEFLQVFPIGLGMY